jgi:uncharacterized membrane protein
MYPANLLPLISAFSIFPIWAVEQVFPYPHIIEELAKSLFIANTEPSKKTNPYTYMALSGLSFGISESILYQILNIQTNTGLGATNRIIYVIPMHILTFLVLYSGQQKNKIIRVLSIVTAIGIHYSFNILTGSKY